MSNYSVILYSITAVIFFGFLAFHILWYGFENVGLFCWYWSGISLLSSQKNTINNLKIILQIPYLAHTFIKLVLNLI